MEPASQGRTERSFSYVVRAPSGDSFDVMNVDVTIDTCWVFRDTEDRGGEQGCLQEATAGSLHTETGALGRQLEASEQKLLAAVDNYVTSESGLRSRIRELELAEKRLLRKVEVLGTRVVQERSASLHAQERLRVLQAELASRVREEESAARRLRRLQDRLRRRDEALGRQEEALERGRRIQRRQLGLVREQERVLRAQVQRLERDVRRLCSAAGLLLSRLDAGGPAGVPGDAPGAAEPAVAVRALQARAERGERAREEAARQLREQRARERGLRGQLEDLRCCLYGLQLAEIGLQGRLEELAEQNRRLQAQLGAQASAPQGSPGPVATSYHLAQSQPSSGDKPLLEPRQKSMPAKQRKSRCSGTEAGESMATQPEQHLAPGQCGPNECTTRMLRAVFRTLRRSCPGRRLWILAEAKAGKMASVDEGPRQLALAECGLDGQSLLLVCGCPPGHFMERSLLPVHLVWPPESLPATWELSDLGQMPTVSLWGPSGDLEALLLLPEAPAGELQTQAIPNTRPLPGPVATAHPSRDCHQARSQDTASHQDSTHTSDHAFLRMGSQGVSDVGNEGGGIPVGRAGDQETRRTFGVTEGENSGKGQPRQEGCEGQSPGIQARALDSTQDDSGPSEPQATACSPCPLQECPVCLLQGAAPRSQGGPECLGRRAEGCGWGLPGTWSAEQAGAVPMATCCRADGTGVWWPCGGQLPMGPGRDAQRRLQGGKDQLLCFGNTPPLQDESLGDKGLEEEEEEEKVLPGDVSTLDYDSVPRQPNSEAPAEQEALLSVAELYLPLFPGPAPSSARHKATSPSSAGQDSCSIQIAEFERQMEACFQQLHTWQPGSRGRWRVSMLAENHGSFAPEGHCGKSQQDVASWGSGACAPAEARPRGGREGVRQEKSEALGTSSALRGAMCGGEAASLGPAEPGGNLPSLPPCRALQRARDGFHQLLSALTTEISRASRDNATLRRERERCLHQVRDLENEKAEAVAKISRLGQVHLELVREAARLQGELGQSLRAICDLEECNRQSYCKILELEEEKEQLQKDVGRLRKALCAERARKSRGEEWHYTLENGELKARVTQLGRSPKELRRGVEVETEDLLGASKWEKEQLVHRVPGLEPDTAGLTGSVDSHRVGQGQHAQGSPRRARDQVCTADAGVQVARPLGQLSSGAGQPLLAGGPGPSTDVEDSPTLPPARRNADVPSGLQGGPHGAGGPEEHPEKEGKQLQHAADPGQALESPSSGLQPPGSWAQVAEEEEPWLCIQRLRHQVQTLQCQLRDQGWVNQELQVARDKAVHLQDELRGKLEELQTEGHEARLALTPLKAKLASLVQKCRDRNDLIASLLQELSAHGLASPLLSKLARDMSDDVALAQYAAAFLTPGLSQPGSRESERRGTRHGLQQPAAPAGPASSQHVSYELSSSPLMGPHPCDPVTSPFTGQTRRAAGTEKLFKDIAEQMRQRDPCVRMSPPEGHPAASQLTRRAEEARSQVCQRPGVEQSAALVWHLPGTLAAGSVQGVQMELPDGRLRLWLSAQEGRQAARRH
ncbi:uncharacterized protein C4orf50 homolog [Ctenodactylus gundi]